MKKDKIIRIRMEDKLLKEITEAANEDCMKIAEFIRFCVIKELNR